MICSIKPLIRETAIVHPSVQIGVDFNKKVSLCKTRDPWMLNPNWNPQNKTKCDTFFYIYLFILIGQSLATKLTVVLYYNFTQ